MADWISPDGFSDTDVVWTDEELVYDGNTGTYGWCPQNGNAWQHACDFTFSVNVTNCTKIRIWVSIAPDADWSDFQVRVYDGISNEELVINSKITEGEYVEAACDTVHTINYISVRFCGQTVKYGQQRVHELQAYGEGGPSPPSPGVVAGMRLNARRRRLLQAGEL